MTRVKNYEKRVTQTKRTDGQDREANQKPNVQAVKAKKKSNLKLLQTCQHQKGKINGGYL